MQNSQRSLISASLKMGLATLMSRVLGLVREQAMAYTFGASGWTDAFNVAFRVPNMLRDLFAEGSFSSAFVPVFTEVKIEDPERAKRLLWSMAVLLGIVTSIISLGIFIFAPHLVQFFTDAQFTNDPERFQLTTLLVRVMSPFLVFVSLAALFMGVLNSLKIFFIPALAPAFFNLVMIASILILPGILKEKGIHPVLALGLGVLFGGGIQMLIQLPMIFKTAYGPTGPIQLFSESSRKIFHRVGIGTIGIAATQINILITTILATGTVVGAVSWLNYAFRLFQFPVGILGVSIAGSNLVHFSDAWKANRENEAKEVLGTSAFFSLLTILPAFSLMWPLSDATVQLIFQRGAFDAEDVRLTAMALRCYLLGLPFYAFYKILGPTFFSLDRPKIPVYISIACIVANIIFCLLLVPRWGFQVLALGTSLSMLLNSFLQCFVAKRLLQLPLSFFFNLRHLKIVIAAGLCFGITLWLRQQMAFPVEEFWVSTGQFTLCVLGGCVAYLLSLSLMGEARILQGILKRKDS